MFKIQDGRKSFTQWDLNRKIIVEDESITQVHFTNLLNRNALVSEVKNHLADVPNVLLQDYGTILIYGYDGNYTKYVEAFRVVRKEKPDDYVYTETEVLNYNNLLERINNFEENIDQIIADYLLKNPPKVDLDGYATKEYVDNAIAAITTVDLSNYFTKEETNAKFATKEEIPSTSGLATEEFVNSKVNGLATENYVNEAVAAIPEVDLSGYALKSEIPSTAGLATETFVNEAIAAIPEVDLSGYQEKLTAGDNITIEGNVISATGGSGGGSGGNVAVDGTTIIQNEDGTISTAVGGSKKQNDVNYIISMTSPITVDGTNVLEVDNPSNSFDLKYLKFGINGIDYYAVFGESEYVSGKYQFPVISDTSNLILRIEMDYGNYTRIMFKDTQNLVVDYLYFGDKEFVSYQKIDGNYIPVDGETIKLSSNGELQSGLNTVKILGGNTEVYNLDTDNGNLNMRPVYSGKGYNHIEGYATRSYQYARSCHIEGQSSYCYAGNANHVEGYYCSTDTENGAGNHAEGWQTRVSQYLNATGSGDIEGSHAEGYNTIASSSYQHVQGKYNIQDSNSQYADIIGTGTDANNRANGFTLDWSGNGAFAGQVSSTGSDYAEYFEWADGNPEAEDRVGYLVALDGDKIRLAKPGDEILGIISGTVAVLGDNHEWQWQGKYLTDDYGRVIYDMVDKYEEYEGEQVYLGTFPEPRINPEWDETATYIPRAKRKEWDAVGLLGKLYVRDDGTCKPNDYIKVGADGIATVSAEKTNMRVMSRKTDNIVKVYVR